MLFETKEKEDKGSSEMGYKDTGGRRTTGTLQ